MSVWDKIYDSDKLFIPDKPVDHAIEVAEAVGDYTKIEGKKVLDVGCGVCVISMAFKHCGAHVTGVDLSEKALSIAKDIIDDAYVANAFSIPEDENSYDIVMSSGLLEHFEDDEIERLLLEQARLSKGYVLALVPNMHDLIYQAHKKYMIDNKKWPYGKERDIDVPIYARACGLEVVTTKSLNSQHSGNLLNELSTELGESYTKLIRLVKQSVSGYLSMTLMRAK